MVRRKVALVFGGDGRIWDTIEDKVAFASVQDDMRSRCAELGILFMTGCEPEILMLDFMKNKEAFNHAGHTMPAVLGLFTWEDGGAPPPTGTSIWTRIPARGVEARCSPTAYRQSHLSGTLLSCRPTAEF